MKGTMRSHLMYTQDYGKGCLSVSLWSLFRHININAARIHSKRTFHNYINGIKK